MSKRILYCSDGTWNDSTTNTNVYKIFKAMNFSAEQCPIYDDGVGSDGNPVLHFLGGAFGEGLDQKICEGYTRISHLYEHGDQIFLFGFSRGAYTARSLGGMIVACGLPTQHTDDHLTDLAFQAYREHDAAKKQQLLTSLKNTYKVEPVEISMIGVWDTVGSLGIPAVFGKVDMLRYSFLDTKLHPCVKHAYHAVSIDERRTEFPATLWSGPYAPDQVVEQVYFPGVHCDVGGGYAETGLSDITLGWMMAKAKALGVDFDSAVYERYSNIDPKHALDQKHESWSVRWGWPTPRTIAGDACFSNTVQIRLQHDATYSPVNLKAKAGALQPPSTLTEVVKMVTAAAAAVGTKG